MNKDDYLDNLLSVPRLFRLIVSKKGDMVAFSWKNIHPNVDVFYVDLSAPKPTPIALTKTAETTIALDFFPKSKAVLVSEDKSRNERHRLFKVNLTDPLTMYPLTEENPPYFIRYGDIHPSENWLFYGANYDFSQKKELEPTWIYAHNLETEERIPLAQPTKPAWTYPTLNSLGTHLLYSRKEYHPKGNQIWLVDCEGKDDYEILNFDPQARITATWLPDGKTIAFMTDYKDNKKQTYYSVGIYTVASGEIEWIYDDPKSSIEDLSSPKIGNYLLIHEAEKAKIKTTIFNVSTREKTVLPRIKGNLHLISPAFDGEWLGIYYSSTQPSDLVKFSLEAVPALEFKTITDVWSKAKLTPEDFTPAEDFEWKGKDGLPLHGWLYKPKHPNGKCIVYIHGGPTAHIEDEIIAQVQYYAHRGFLVFAPNYRGSTGYGYEFEDAIRVHGWGSDEQDDIFEGIKALIDQKLVSKGKVGVTGTSYGGYSSWFAITKAPTDLVAAAVPICGMTDLVVDYESTRPDLRPYSEQMLGGTPEEVPERYFERSPINFVQNIRGALLIVQGAQDPNVTPKNVDAVRKRLDEYSIDYELLIFENEGHGIIKTENQKVLYQRIADFFKKAL